MTLPSKTPEAFLCVTENTANVAAAMDAIPRPLGLGALRVHSGVKRKADDDGAFKSPGGKVARLLSLEGLEPLTPLTPSVRHSLESLEAVVVNLERRPDRMVGCAARLQAYAPWLHYEKFPACDGRVEVMSEKDVLISWNTARNVEYQKERAIRKGWNDLDSYKVRDLAMSAGERGCAVSHIRAWQECLRRSARSSADASKPLLVLEDDAAPTPEFTTLLTSALGSLPKDVDVLYLGYSQAAGWRRIVSPELVEAEYVWTTVAYLVWPKGAKKMLEALPVNQPVDNWMATLCAEGHLKSYCIRPKIVLQAEAWNVNSDVGHSDELYWGPCSDIHHSDTIHPAVDLERTCAVDAADIEAAVASGLQPTEWSSLQAPGGFAEGSCLWDLDGSDDEDA